MKNNILEQFIKLGSETPESELQKQLMAFVKARVPHLIVKQRTFISGEYGVVGSEVTVHTNDFPFELIEGLTDDF